MDLHLLATPQDPQFKQKAAPVLDLYNELWDGSFTGSPNSCFDTAAKAYLQ